MYSNKIVKNSIANIIAKIWSILSLYLFVPIWIHFLGVEGYGIISFFTILMTIMHFADAGLTATLTREFARDDKDERYKRYLLRTIEVIYIGIALLLFILIFCFSSIIVNLFLKSDIYEHKDLCFFVQIMGLTLAIHFMYSMYSGGLLGLQKQVIANVISVSYSISRCAIVILPLLIWPSVKVFLIWQLISIIIAFILARFYVVKSITVTGNDFSFRPHYIRLIWRFATGMMMMAVISALNTQLDKLVTGNVLSLANLGYYSLASTLGFAVLSIVQPLGVAFYPELTRIMSTEEKSDTLFLLFTYVISMISTVIGMTIFFYFDEFAYLWTHNMETVNIIKIPARLLIIGNIFQSLQLSPYYLALSNGHTSTNVKLGLFMLLFMIPSVYLLTKQIGLNGTAIPFVILNVIGYFYLGAVITNKFFCSKGLIWLKYSITPCLTCSLFVFLFFLIGSIFDNIITRTIYGALTCILSFYFSIIILVNIYPAIVNYIPMKYKFFFNINAGNLWKKKNF